MVSLNSGNRESLLALAQPVSVGQVLTAQHLKQVYAVDPGMSVVESNQVASVVLMWLCSVRCRPAKGQRWAYCDRQWRS